MSAGQTVVVHLLGRLEIGGAERMLLSLCRAMPQEQYRQCVVSLSGESGRLTPEFESVGTHEILCGITPLWSFPFRISRMFRQTRPDVVVSHVSLASGFLLVLAQWSHVRRRIALFHSDGDGRAVSGPRRLYRGAMRRLLNWSATDVVGVTESTLRFSGAERNASVASRVVPSGVDLDVFQIVDKTMSRRRLDLPATGLVLVHAGRAAPEKNRQMLPKLLRAIPGSPRLLLAGATTTEDLGLDPSDPIVQQIQNLGLMLDITELLSAGDLLVLPSIREGLPLVILEALACGRPVVASDLPGIRLVAEDLPDIHLVPLGATPEEFAAVVCHAEKTKRSETEIRKSLISAGLDLNTSLKHWMELCQPSS